MLSDLSLHQPVDDGLQRLVPVAGQNPLEVLRAVLQGFGHRHVQVVVGLLRRQVLRGTTTVRFNAHPAHQRLRGAATYDDVKLGVDVDHPTWRRTRGRT